MIETKQIQQAHEDAQNTWASIGWSLKSFQTHVNHVSREMSENPSLHLNDLYLAGAAACRIMAAWEVIEREIGPQIRAALRGYRRITENLAEEIWSDTRTRLMEPIEGYGVLPSGDRPARLIYYKGSTRLYTYILRTAMNRLSDRNRREKVRHAWSPEDGQVLEDTTTESPMQRNAERESHRPFREALVNGFNKLTSRQTYILAMVCGDHSVSQKDIADTLGTSPATVCRELKRAEGTLRDAVTARFSAEELPRMAKDILSDLIFDLVKSGQQLGVA